MRMNSSENEVRRKLQCRIVGRMLRKMGDTLNEEYLVQRSPLQQACLIAVNVFTWAVRELYC